MYKNDLHLKKIEDSEIITNNVSLATCSKPGGSNHYQSRIDTHTMKRKMKVIFFVISSH